MIFIAGGHGRLGGFGGHCRVARRGPGNDETPAVEVGWGGAGGRGRTRAGDVRDLISATTRERSPTMPRPEPDDPKPPAAQHQAAQQEAAQRPYPELPAVVDLPAIEREVLARWREGRLFERSLEQTSAGRPWTVYEGPPTATGIPGAHHREARVFEDPFPRFTTMQGFHVPRQ